MLHNLTLLYLVSLAVNIVIIVINPVVATISVIMEVSLTDNKRVQLWSHCASFDKPSIPGPDPHRNIIRQDLP